MELMGLFLGLIFFVVIILVTRLFGAWMLRIDEVISNQRIIINELKKLNNINNQD